MTASKSSQEQDRATITVLGAGYVGLTTAALFANSGFKVYLVEPNKQRLKVIQSGKSFFYEEGIDPLIKRAIDVKALIPASSYEESIPKSKYIFSCVGTPDNPDGSSNLEYVFGAAEVCAKHIREGSIYAQKSTVPVGTGNEVQKIFENKSVEYVSNPEFLREGTAISDSLFFDRIVVGGKSKKATEEVLAIYKTVEKTRNKIAKLAGINTVDYKGEYIQCSLESAELIKVTSNAFLALKISFANSIAKLADQTGADVVEVMKAVGADTRIGKAFLNAGRGYGGGCFPKDVSGLISSAEQHGVEMEIMSAATAVNDSMSGYIVNQVQKELGGTLRGKKVALLGLAFKAGTSDSRRSPSIKLANTFLRFGAQVSAYDPKANHEAQEELNPKVALHNSMDKGADAVLIATDWPEFISMDLNKLTKKMSGNLFVDCMNCFNPKTVDRASLKYMGVGKH
jgi:UDPglucose 6-dehydrogenase